MAENSPDVSNEISQDQSQTKSHGISSRTFGRLRAMVRNRQEAARDRFIRDTKLAPADAPDKSSFLGIAVDQTKSDLGAQYNKDTGLRNRDTFVKETNREIAKVNRNPDLHGLLVGMLDIDKFGIFNSTYGIPTGDKALRAVAEALDDSVRETDLTGRWGGEEFSFALPFDHESPKNPPENYLHMRQTTNLDKRTPGERIRQAIEDIPVSSDIPEKLTASIGLTEYIPGETFEQINERASLAMLIAKLTGKNRSVVAKYVDQEWQFQAEYRDENGNEKTTIYKTLTDRDGKKLLVLEEIVQNEDGRKTIIPHHVKYSTEGKPKLVS
jgi:GGDEF domain-containing protein